MNWRAAPAALRVGGVANMLLPDRVVQGLSNATMCQFLAPFACRETWFVCMVLAEGHSKQH